MSEQRFRMVISDVQTQPMDGMELLQQIRQQDQLTPVVVMTAYGTIEKAVDAMRLGASDYLVKPFAFEELLARVRALGRRRAPIAVRSGRRATGTASAAT